MQTDDEIEAAIKQRLQSEEEAVPTAPSTLSKIRSRLREIQNTRSGIEEIEPVEVEVEESYEDALRNARASKWDSSVPTMWRSMDIASLPNELRKSAVEWLNTGGNLVVMGPTGCGKSSLAYAVARESYLRGKKVKVWNAPELFDDMRPSDNSAKILESARTAELLVLDDLGAQKDTEWVYERIYLIINYRWEWQLPTIVTTNLSPEAFSRTVPDRITSRLLHNANVLLLKGVDHREVS